jgi:hypothetical protein
VVEDHVAIEIIEFHGVLRRISCARVRCRRKPVDFLEGVVEGERGAGRGRQFEEVHDRHGAVMAGANGDAVLVEMVPRSCGCTPATTKDTRLALSAAVPTMRSRRFARRSRWHSRAGRVRAHAPHRQIQPLEEIHRGAQADGAGNVRRAGLEFVGQGVVGGLLEAHGQNHVAAALPGRHALEQRLAAVQHADAGGAEHLVAGEGVEIAAQFLHVDGMCGTAWAPSTSVVMPRALAAATRRRTGSTVPSALDTCAQANIGARAHQRFDRIDMHLAARVHGRTTNLAPVCSHTICQGTMLA